MIHTAALAAYLLVLATTSAFASDHFLSGRVSKIADGDAITIDSDGVLTRIRFCGVDSPERRQRGYGEASKALGSLIGGKDVRCIQVGGGTPCDGRSKPISRDRVVAQCVIGDRRAALLRAV